MVGVYEKAVRSDERFLPKQLARTSAKLETLSLNSLVSLSLLSQFSALHLLSSEVDLVFGLEGCYPYLTEEAMKTQLKVALLLRVCIRGLHSCSFICRVR